MVDTTPPSTASLYDHAFSYVAKIAPLIFLLFTTSSVAGPTQLLCGTTFHNIIIFPVHTHSHIFCMGNFTKISTDGIESMKSVGNAQLRIS